VCRQCCASYQEDGDLPPCALAEDRKCTLPSLAVFTEGYVAALTPEDRLAWNVYTDIIALSPMDVNRMPTLTLLREVFEPLKTWMSEEEVYLLLRRIRQIHTQILNTRLEKSVGHN